MGKRKPSKAFLIASAKWRAHLAEYRKAHPGQSLKQQMKGAKKTYKKSKSQPISVRNTQYSVQVRPRTRKVGKRTKRPKKRTSRKKRSFFGF
jgi:lipocalin